MLPFQTSDRKISIVGLAGLKGIYTYWSAHFMPRTLPFCDPNTNDLFWAIFLNLLKPQDEPKLSNLPRPFSR